MELDLVDIAADFRRAHRLKSSRHDVLDRLQPSISQYDYLCLSTLVADIKRLVEALPSPAPGITPLALDIGCGKSPYRALLEGRGFMLKTVDIDNDSGPNFVGSIEATGLPDRYADVVLCTQVLEHCSDPQQGVREVFRILRAGGYLIASAPHVWFYHPHPSDNWRFTQEGLTRLVAAAGLEPLKLLSQGGSVLSFFQVMNFLLYGVLGTRGAPFYALGNLAGRWGDRVVHNSLFCHNFAILAQKPH